MNQTSDYNRIYGIDLLRTISFAAIAIHHFNSKLWYMREFSPFVDQHWFWRFAEVFARSISFSGHTILFLTSFMVAFTSVVHEKSIKIIPILLVFWVVSSLSDYSESTFLLTWDIFALIALGMGVCWLFFSYFKSSIWAVPLSGALLISIPFWKLQALNDMSLFWKHILIGDCNLDLADWPVLPWIGLIFLGYGLGVIAKSKKYLLANRPTYFEIWIWVLSLVWCPFLWGVYYPIVLGDHYSCEVSRQEPIVFWAHLLPIAFVIRMSMMSRLNHFFSDLRICKGLSGLRINTDFGYAYIVHFLVIDLLVLVFKSNMVLSSGWSFLALGLVLPLTELAMRACFWARAKVRAR